jgi:5,10-methylenetetrahydromethanopterin reductase
VTSAQKTPLRLGVAVRSDRDPQFITNFARKAESLGIESVWLAESYHYRSVIPMAALIAAGTTRITIGTAIVPSHSRHPGLLAMEALTLDEISGGRFILGVASAPNVGKKQRRNMSWLASIRDALNITRPMLAGKEVDYEGPAHGINQSRLLVPPTRRVPVYVGTYSWSPKTIAIAGELSDGVIYAWGVPAQVRRAAEALAEGAERVGRDPSEVDVASLVVMAVDENEADARDRCKPTIAVYAPSTYPDWLKVGMITEDDVKPVLDAHATGGFEAATRAVPDSLVEKVAIAGNARYCRDRLHALADAGLKLAIAYGAHGSDPEYSLECIANGVLG